MPCGRGARVAPEPGVVTCAEAEIVIIVTAVSAAKIWKADMVFIVRAFLPSQVTLTNFLRSPKSRVPSGFADANATRGAIEALLVAQHV